MGKRKWKEGSVVQIKLANGNHTYARLNWFPMVSFYDLNTAQVLQVEEICAYPVAFSIFVSQAAIIKNRWPIIGCKALEPHLRNTIEMFRQDVIDGSFSIHTFWQGGSGERPATRVECEHLERYAVWDYDHVEQRLIDHFNDVPNKWVESLRPR